MSIPVKDQTANALFKALSNSKRITILQYLDQCMYATNGVITKNTKIPQPQVTNALKMLLAVNLVTEERAGKRKVYLLNQTVWEKIKLLL